MSDESGEAVDIHTGGTHVHDGVTRWKTGGSRSRAEESVENADLWRQLAAATEPHDVGWCWVENRMTAGDVRPDELVP